VYRVNVFAPSIARILCRGHI